MYSDFLLRTCRADRVDTKTLRILIRNFGKSGGEEINLFAYDKVYWSGIFNRAYTYELENGEIQENSGLDYTVLRPGYLRDGDKDDFTLTWRGDPLSHI